MAERRDDRVYVITGASSGMGRAVALKLAERGASVVVAARRGEVLDDVVRECEARGGRAVAVPADVTQPEDVARVARRAEEAFGRIDVWIHPAAVAAFGRVDETPVDVQAQVVQTILGGTIHVVHEAVSRFKARGGGTLVVVASALGEATIPFLGPYNAAKFGVIGYMSTLREELRMDGLEDVVRTSTVMPPATDTPFYAHAANFVGNEAKPPFPIYSVWTLADAIVEAADDPKPEVTVGAAGKLMVTTYNAVRPLYDATIGPYAKTMFTDRDRAPTPGNVFEPMREGTTPEGGWKDQPLSTQVTGDTR